jgi:hypothetical protein
VLAVAGQQHDPGPTASWVETRRSSRPSQTTRPALGGAAGEAVEQLGLAVALGAGDAHVSPRCSVKADRAERLALEAVDDQHLPGLRSAFGGDAGGKAASKGRPTISSTSWASVVAAASKVPWLRPSRSTVIRSAISSTSGGGG